MKPIILASTSPRRKDLLERIGVPCCIYAPKYEEVIPKEYTENISEHFACQKLLSTLPNIKSLCPEASFVISADTVIVYKTSILGKPKDIYEARKFLDMISGNLHEVHTSIAVYNRETDNIIAKSTKNIVDVHPLTSKHIDWYLSKNEWIDAAGAYKIQGAFQRFIRNIEGTQSSVMGLPLFETCDILESQGYEFS